MFSSKELITFVFANENDIYYGEDLLRLNLDQYLWEQLHDSYEAVYFLSAEDDVFQVRTFGDRCCNAYTPGKKSWWGKSTEQTKQGEWLLSQLRGKTGKTAAFVCPMEDFCSVLSGDRWESVLEQIANTKMRTGIFVLTAPATAERTKELLLKSPVFDKLHESTVTGLRGGTLREMYSTIKKQKWDNCLFLNSFSWERIHALLLHLAMEHPEWCESCQQLDQMADYLTLYLRNRDQQDAQPLLAGDLPAGYLMYKELYEKLSSQRVWTQLVQRSNSFSQLDRECLKREESPDIYVPVLRDQNGYAGKCLRMRLPKWIYDNEEEGVQADGILQKIRSCVSVPKNRMENQQIMDAADGFIAQADAVREGDIDTYKQLLGALKFCVNWVYTDPEDIQHDRVLDIIEKQKSLVLLSEQCFTQKQALDTSCQNTQMGPLQQKTVDTLKAEYYTHDQLRRNYADMISALILGLTMPSDSASIMEKLQDLEQEIREWENRPQTEPVQTEQEILPQPEPEEEPQRQWLWQQEQESSSEEPAVQDEAAEDIQEEFALRPEDWTYHPPVY